MIQIHHSPTFKTVDNLLVSTIPTSSHSFATYTHRCNAFLLQNRTANGWQHTHSILAVMFIRLAVGFGTSTTTQEHITQTAVESLRRHQKLHTCKMYKCKLLSRQNQSLKAINFKMSCTEHNSTTSRPSK